MSHDCRSTETILLQHDNARTYASHTTSAVFKQLKFVVIQQPLYLPDLAPCDFHFFSDLKRDFKGLHFTSDEEVKEAVKSWINTKQVTYSVTV